MDAAFLRALLSSWAELMAEKKEWLIELDSVVGDSDLGLTMSDGFQAAAAASAESDETDVGKLAYLAGKAMAAVVPSTMGTLMASGLMNAGKTLKGQAEAADRAFFQAYYDGVRNRGKAELGEKTFLDGFAPAVEVLKNGGTPAEAAETAWQAFQDTRGMLAKHGRMAIRGEASRDLLDPGAAVAALLMKGYSETMKQG